MKAVEPRGFPRRARATKLSTSKSERRISRFLCLADRLARRNVTVYVYRPRRRKKETRIDNCDLVSPAREKEDRARDASPFCGILSIGIKTLDGRPEWLSVPFASTICQIINEDTQERRLAPHYPNDFQVTSDTSTRRFPSGVSLGYALGD